MNKELVRKDFLENIRQIISQSRSQTYRAVNYIMVETYWNIGKMIVEEEQNGKERAEYGKYLISELSKKLTDEFGRGFDESNLWNFRQFYLTFPILDTLCRELNWSQCKILMRIENQQARQYYAKETVEQQWSVRQLERQIHTFTYERLLKNKEIVLTESNNYLQKNIEIQKINITNLVIFLAEFRRVIRRVPQSFK